MFAQGDDNTFEVTTIKDRARAAKYPDGEPWEYKRMIDFYVQYLHKVAGWGL